MLLRFPLPLSRILQPQQTERFCDFGGRSPYRAAPALLTPIHTISPGLKGDLVRKIKFVRATSGGSGGARKRNTLSLLRLKSDLPVTSTAQAKLSVVGGGALTIAPSQGSRARRLGQKSVASIAYTADPGCFAYLFR